jgi:hypothetical protein
MKVVKDKRPGLDSGPLVVALWTTCPGMDPGSLGGGEGIRTLEGRLPGSRPLVG